MLETINANKVRKFDTIKVGVVGTGLRKLTFPDCRMEEVGENCDRLFLFQLEILFAF